MNSKEYEKNVLVTESADTDVVIGRIDKNMIRLLHAGLGLSSELSELVSAYAAPKNDQIDWVNISEEAGDALFYTAVAINTLGFDHDDISSFESAAGEHGLVEKHSIPTLQGAILAAVASTGDYNDLLKKHLFYGRPLDREKIGNVLKQLCMAISGLCIVSGTTIAEARQTNINKLRARYGDKFTEAAALNRDLDAERKILEDGINGEEK
jgi:NTP pyrophosphatase (non-canonical NTP hydrolase)